MRRIATALVLLTAALAGCGGGALTDDEELAVAEARVAFAHVVLDGSSYGAALEGVDRLVAIYRAKPDAKYDDLTMRQVVQDGASKLDRYQPDMAAGLDRALR